MSWRLNNNKHPCAYTYASIHACMFIFIFWSRPRYRISQSIGMAVSEFLLLRDKILRRVTNSPALLYCTGRCHTFALQGSELLLPFVRLLLLRLGEEGQGEVLGRWVAQREGLALDIVQKINVQAVQTLPDMFTG